SGVEERARGFFAGRMTLILGTAGKDSKPTASYAPFVPQFDLGRLRLYVYTSTLSQHTSDMVDSRKASALLLEDEQEAKNLFARKRITFSCDARHIVRQTHEWLYIMDRFRDRFGMDFDPIRALGDFVLFRLEPTEAVYVEGFGQAYRLNGELYNPVHIMGTGPGAKAHEPA
ncbi:MAG: pyridoxamine 5'-phosphate oxidase family protein, partial [Patescibacteria group bacterium]